MKTDEIIIMVIFCFLSATLGIMGYHNYLLVQEINTMDKTNSCNYLQREYSNATAIGLYIGDCGYFVYTKGRTAEQIQTTEYHEACHALVYQDYEHFCIDVPRRD